MGNIPAAKISPRLEFGILKWYAGDTFSVQVNLNFTDRSGHAVTLTAEDTAQVRFYTVTGSTVEDLTFEDLSAGFVTLEFDEARSGKFPRGRYLYDIVVTHENVTTAAKGNRILVE